MTSTNIKNIRVLFGRQPLFAKPFNEIVIVGEDAARQTVALMPSWRGLDEGSNTPPDAFIRVEDAQIEGLLNQIWDAGFRPKNGEGASAQVTALRKHLEHVHEEVAWLREQITATKL